MIDLMDLPVPRAALRERGEIVRDCCWRLLAGAGAGPWTGPGIWHSSSWYFFLSRACPQNTRTGAAHGRTQMSDATTPPPDGRTTASRQQATGNRRQHFTATANFTHTRHAGKREPKQTEDEPKNLSN